MVVCVTLGRADVADGLKQSMALEPQHPFERSELEGLSDFPWRPAVNQFGLA